MLLILVLRLLLLTNGGPDKTTTAKAWPIPPAVASGGYRSENDLITRFESQSEILSEIAMLRARKLKSEGARN
jgi:hypothetical protein